MKRALLLVAALAACQGGDARRRVDVAVPVTGGGGAADGGVDVLGPGARYYSAYLAETVDGDREAARAGYLAVLEAAGPDDVAVAARAALRLAGLYAAEGRRREALELLARAAALGADDPEIIEAVDGLRLQLASSGGPESVLRGPPPGAGLDGVSPEAAARFARAEALLVAYQERRVRARVEKFDEDVGRKEAALDAAVRAYRQVIELDEPVATAAAEFRIGSLHHDWALTALTLEIPPELEPAYAVPVRRDLQRRALRSLGAARTAYAASLGVGGSAGAAELWHAAARSGKRAVDEMLGQAP